MRKVNFKSLMVAVVVLASTISFVFLNVVAVAPKSAPVKQQMKAHLPDVSMVSKAFLFAKDNMTVR